jgi:hypothetical protein
LELQVLIASRLIFEIIAGRMLEIRAGLPICHCARRGDMRVGGTTRPGLRNDLRAPGGRFGPPRGVDLMGMGRRCLPV